MRTSIFLLVMVYCSGVFAQRVNPGTPTSMVSSTGTMSLSGGNDPFVFGKGIDMTNAKYTDVDGSPFFNQDYKPALVVFKNGTTYKDVPVKFDMLHNEIDIYRNNELICLIGLDSVSFSDSAYTHMLLRTSFPPINKLDTSTIYQVLAQNNKIELLKYYHCSISTVRSVGMPDKSSFDVNSQYYLFDKSKKTIKEIKLNKKSFSNAISDMGYSIKDVNFKNETELSDLVNSKNL